MDHNFKPSDFYTKWDTVRYETVFILIVDDDIEPEDVIEPVIRALCAIGLFKEGDKFKCAKAGNAIIFGKGHFCIDVSSLDTVN